MFSDHDKTVSQIQNHHLPLRLTETYSGEHWASYPQNPIHPLYFLHQKTDYKQSFQNNKEH